MTTVDTPPCARATPSPAASGGDPLVSVIVPVRNGRATLGRALKSVAGQDYPRLEVIVVDDGSVDDVGDVVEAFSQLDLKFKRLPRPVGVAAARNQGLAMSSGEFVAFLDADDEWLAGKTGLQIKALCKDPGLAFSHAGALSMLRGREAGPLSEATSVSARGVDAWKTLLKHGCVVTSSVMARRSLVLALGGFNTALAVGEDQDLWIRLALQGSVHREARPLIRKYNRASSIMNQSRNLIADVTLPMIETHVAELGGRLTARERAEILAYRRLVAGRNCYEAGRLRRGARLVLSAAREHGLARSLAYLASASPVAQSLKRVLGRRQGADSDRLAADLSWLKSPLFAAVVDVRGLSARSEHAQWLDDLSRIFLSHRLVPAILVDEPILDDERSVALVADFCKRTRGDVGLHLPASASRRESAEDAYGRDVGALARLASRIRARVGLRPVIHQTDDPGPDPARTRALSAVGFEIDLGGGPFWFGEDGELLGVPLTSPGRLDVIRSGLSGPAQIFCLSVNLGIEQAAIEGALTRLEAGGAKAAGLREIREAIREQAGKRCAVD